MTKTLTVKAGKSISCQPHHNISEVWTIVDGEGEFVLEGERMVVRRGDVLNVPGGHHHGIRATASGLTLIEVQIVLGDIHRM